MFFVQINDTGIGTIFVPTYTRVSKYELFWRIWILEFYRIFTDEFGEIIVQFISEKWFRFLDDCETLLDKTKIDPMETSDKELPLLDLLIGRNDGKIWMDIYFKPTDTRWCFLFLSRTIVRKIYVLL